MKNEAQNKKKTLCCRVAQLKSDNIRQALALEDAEQRIATFGVDEDDSMVDKAIAMVENSIKTTTTFNSKFSNIVTEMS